MITRKLHTLTLFTLVLLGLIPTIYGATRLPVKATGNFTSADLAVFKNAPPNATAGSDVSFDVTVSNFGPDDAATVSLSDPLPPGMIFVSATQNSGPTFSCSTPGVGVNGTITCTIALLTAGASANFTFVANIPPATPAGTTFTNIATVSTATFDPNDENNSSTGTTIVPSPQADLSVVKNGPAAAMADTNVSYSITVTNQGPDAAASVSLTDELPGTMTFISMLQNSGPAFDCNPLPSVGSGGIVTCTIDPLSAGATATFTLTGHIPPGTASGASFENIANINSTTSDPNTDNNQSSQLTVVSSTDLAITKTGPATATAGGTIAWTITVSNNAGDTEQNPSFSDTLPAGTTFNSLVQNTGAAATCSTPAPNNPGTVNCSLQPLASVGSAQFTLTANISPTSAGTLNNTATVTGTNSDPDTSNNSQTASATVSASADLTINKTGPASANAGSDITYTITLTNNGPSAASAVSLTDSTPANTTFVSETQTTGSPFSCGTPAVGGTGTITCSTGLFPVGSATFSITLHIAAGTTTGSIITNTANVSSTTTDPNPSDNSSSANTTVTASPNADLAITKTPAPGPYGTGQQLTYTIVVTNGGPSAATAVTVTDTLPAGTTLVSSTPPGACSGSPVVTCNAGTITNGGNATFTLTVTLPSSSGPFTNTAVVSAAATNPDPNPGNNTATSTITVIPAANIPMISPLSLLLLCIALAAAGAFVQKS
ncbi:MAG: DUF11 domain-containing protein [Acidobacteria bacterium]|nr:DUF11 domain-containing protein [Acidobacteriota bacterium]MBV9070229.1 DUF11 domain-containing protein [Acidobacteriota bacterium]MBV9184911.1 DUF11 domain-containing protein [Acidobacteriota bacterium]